MIKFEKLPTSDYEYLKSWINKFLSDLNERFHNWSLKQDKEKSKILKTFQGSPFDMTSTDELITLAGKKWKLCNVNNILVFGYTPGKKSDYYLMVRLDRTAITLIISDLTKDIGNDLIMSIEITSDLLWNDRANIFSLINPHVTIKKGNEPNVEFKKFQTRGRIKLFPSMDINFEICMRNIYNSVFVGGDLSSAEKYRIELGGSKIREIDTDSFYYNNTPGQVPVFITKDWTNLKSPNLLVFEEVKQLVEEKKDQPIVTSVTYTVLSDGSIKRVKYPKEWVF